jgi:D-inositol-3-phosphate glycosyltransferase
MNVHVRELAKAIANRGVMVDVFTRKHDYRCDGCEADSDGANYVHLPAGPPDAPLGDLPNYLDEFAAGVREYQQRHAVRYLAIHSHYWLSGQAGSQVAAESGTPQVVTFHTLSRIKLQSRSGEQEPAVRQETEERIIAEADCVVAFSPHERDAMVRLYGADGNRVELVPCGVDLSRFRPIGRTAARRELGLNGHKVMLYVGRIEPLKGADLLLHAAASLESEEGVQVLVVGSDAEGSGEIERLHQLSDDLQLGDAVEFVGRVPQERLALYYSAADVCVVPSFYESFGLAALESMACGTPVVASRVGGLSTIVQHGRTGYLKSWRCPEAFAQSLEMIMANEDLRDSMGRAARNRAEMLSWDQVAGRLLALYERLRSAREDQEAIR